MKEVTEPDKLHSEPDKQHNTHNALRQVKIEQKRWCLQGFSISGLSSYFQIPELDLCVDMGECPMSALSLNHVLLTHSHGDHSRCLMRHNSLRRMMQNPTQAVYYIPEPVYELAVDLIRAETLFEGVSEERFYLPRLECAKAGERFALAYRKDLEVFPFNVKHSIAAFGYTVFCKKKKLKKEYALCSRDEIISMKKSGVEIECEVREPIVSFMGDCLGESLWEERHIWNSPAVICECTFLEHDEVSMARKKGHTHIEHLAQVLSKVGSGMACQSIILTHFSMKYSKKQIIETVNKAIPEEFRERVKVFL
ncbi:MAG: MBL fold metallo-hydrolase [Fibromonadales bacterium]|nr:MBL fold metallo-hydrolase [Fibromonadales bacterium]